MTFLESGRKSTTNSLERSAPIYLCESIVKPQRFLKHRRRTSEIDLDKSLKWLYLGQDYIQLRQWQESLGSKWDRLSYSKRLQSLAIEWREPYLEWIADLGLKHKSLQWWSSSIAERNTYGNSLFHSICYLQIGLEYVFRETSPLLIVVENIAVMRSLANQCELGIVVKCFKSRFRIRKQVKSWVGAYALYFLDGFRAVWDARRTRLHMTTVPLKTKKTRILIHTCIDESYFGDDGKSHNRYFGPLVDELRKRGYEVITMPWLYNLRRSRIEAFEWFRQHQSQYLIPEDFYSIWDYFWAASVVLRQYFLPTGEHFFQGLDITSVVRDACSQQARRTGAAKFILYYVLTKKLAKSRMKLDFFIDTFENMITEKPQVMGFHKFMPWVTTVGFQHYIEAIPLMLCLFTTEKEGKFAPHPDTIVCNSEHMVERMSQLGFPREKLRVGPSLRYLHFARNDLRPSRETGKVLVILPLGEDNLFEIMDKLHQAFPKGENIKFWLKPHPMMGSDRLSVHFERSKLLEHFSLVKGEIGEWLSRSSCVVVMASTAAVEAALAGVPVVIVGRETDFDLNSLGWFAELESPAYSPTELRKALYRQLSLPEPERERLREWARKMRGRMLSPINEETLSVFVQKN
jgi:hypothetical protein